MKAAEWIQTQPWMMTVPALHVMTAIAERAELDEETIKSAMHGPLSLALRDGKRRDDSQQMTMRDGVAIIPVDGPIYRYADFFSQVSGGVTTEALAKDFQRAQDDPACEAILFVFDSPGGEATSINELCDRIYQSRGQKPMGGYIEGMCASAAYYFGSALDWLVCDASAWVGSIGTILGIPDPTKQSSRSIQFVSTQSPKKRIDPTTAAGAEHWTQKADAMTEVFINRVMRDRGMTYEQVTAIEGDMLIGQQAIDAGLVDELGSEESAFARLKQQAAAKRKPSYSRMEVQTMDWKTFWGGMFEASAEVEGTPLAAAIEQSAATLIVPQPQQAADDPRIAELEKQLAAMQTQAIEARAASFVSGLVANNRALPAEAAELSALYCQAAQDDARDNLGRVTRLETVYQARIPHQLTEELIPGEHTALNLDRAPQNSASSRQALLQMTPVGRRVLAKSA